MIWIIYQGLIRIFDLGLKIYANFNSKARLAIEGRKKTFNFPVKKHKRVWFHCASLGEFEQARTVIEKLKHIGNIEVYLSFFSPSGFENKKNYPLADQIFYMPLDIPFKVEPFLNELDPDVAIFIKYEFWWNFIKQIKARKIPLIFISSMFRREHYFFKLWAKPFFNLFKTIDFFFLIDENSKVVLESHKIMNSRVIGDTRVESILNRSKENNYLPIIEKFKSDKKLLILGSTYPIEHAEIVNFSTKITSDYKILIFPHEINHSEIKNLQEKLGKTCLLYSEIGNNATNLMTDYIIVDSIGKLADAYRYADVAYIGGGFSHGLHNILEAFVYKIPIVFGPKHTKFSEAVYLSKKPFVRVINEIKYLEDAIIGLQNQEFKIEIEDAFNSLFEKSSNASQQIIDYLKKNHLN